MTQEALGLTLDKVQVIIKVAKNGGPLTAIAIDFLDPEPAGEQEPIVVNRPQNSAYVVCYPVIQTVKKGTIAKVNYVAGPRSVPKDTKVNFIPGNINKDLEEDSLGSITVAPTSDTILTFTTMSIFGVESTDCKINVVDEKPGLIDVNVDERYVYGYNVNEQKIPWNYPIGVKLDGKIVDYIEAPYTMTRTPISVTPNMNYTVTISVSGKDADSLNLPVPPAPPNTSFSFSGGIWRHYTNPIFLDSILTSMSILASNPGDLGSGAYFTDLAIEPDCVNGEKMYSIARLLRLFRFVDDDRNPLVTLNGNLIDLSNPIPGDEDIVLGSSPASNKFYKTTSTSFVDLLFNSKSYTSLIQGDINKKTLRRQYKYLDITNLQFLENTNNVFFVNKYSNSKVCN